MTLPYREVSFHIDMDSPRKLLEFWGVKDVVYSNDQLERFYEVSMNRALSFFSEHGIKATFFVVGDELECSAIARDQVRMAYDSGHEIANHTFSHPFGIGKFDKLKLANEIKKCSDIIARVTGSRPVGFRAPGYDINGPMLDLLEELSFTYDSSAFWTVLNPVWKCYQKLFCKNFTHGGFGESGIRLPRVPYYPSRDDWQKKGVRRDILEIPLPRTKILNMPFYNNFHLSINKIYRSLNIGMMKAPYFVYLFHLIEFVDKTDDIPEEIQAHPNIKMKLADKLCIMKETIERIVKDRQSIRTDEYVNRYRS